MNSSLNQSIISFGATALVLAGMAALARGALRPALRFQPRTLPTAMPWKERLEMEHTYGRWALNMAEAICPRGDMDCIKREAKRMYEARMSRIRLTERK